MTTWIRRIVFALVLVLALVVAGIAGNWFLIAGLVVLGAVVAAGEFFNWAIFWKVTGGILALVLLCGLCSSFGALQEKTTAWTNAGWEQVTGREFVPPASMPDQNPPVGDGFVPDAPPAPAAPISDNGTPGCQNHGVTAWNPDNRTDGGTYGEVPVGGLDEPCWVVAQVWWEDADGTPHRATYAVAPHTVVWISDYLGGMGWYFSGDLAAVKANLAEQATQLLERDGEMDTIIVVLPDDADEFPILTRFQVKK